MGIEIGTCQKLRVPGRLPTLLILINCCLFHFQTVGIGSMLTQHLSFSKTLNPNPFLLSRPTFPFAKMVPLSHSPPKTHEVITSNLAFPLFSDRIHISRPSLLASAGRSKNPSSSSSGGRIEGNAEIRREAKRNAKRKSKQLAESLFYRLKNPHRTHADNFTKEELQMIGLGYDRMVRFMDKDDPNLKHPYDWYKYGEFGPYSWRGVVLGDPVRGRFSDETVTMMGEVENQEEWEEIEQFEMSTEFGKRLDELDQSVGLRHFWVFVRHPKWRISDLPWEQWTLVCEVAVQFGKGRLDKWTLMGRLGNQTRKMITQCAAWMRPDIIYVKRPVYQCRFEPQDDFFTALMPLLDPSTEQDYLFELRHEDGRVELCTYFAGLCKIVKVNPKAFVDDVVKAYVKLSDERKSQCLEFLLNNHPVQLLHPYTKEWKAKLEELELGCDAPEDNETAGNKGSQETEFTDWIEDDSDGEDDIVMDTEEDEDGDEDEDGEDEEETEEYWEEEFKKALNSNEEMEKFAKRSVDKTHKTYKKCATTEQERSSEDDGDEMEMRGKRAKVSEEEWKRLGYGPYRRKVKKSKTPPGLFLRAAVRPFTYRNLVKEIVLTRHAILEGEIGRKN